MWLTAVPDLYPKITGTQWKTAQLFPNSSRKIPRMGSQLNINRDESHATLECKTIESRELPWTSYRYSIKIVELVYLIGANPWD